MRSSAAFSTTRSSTMAPISTTAPVSSAKAMNSPGGTSPRSGWFQRTSASRATARQSASDTTGW